MVLSLFMTVPAKSEAGNTDNKHVCTIEVAGLSHPMQAVSAGVDEVYLGSAKAAYYAAGVYSINNGKFDLDPDDTMYLTSQFEFTFYIQPADITEWEQVTSAQVHWNYPSICSNATGYDEAEIAISGSYVFITVKSTPANAVIGAANITAVPTELEYNTYVPTELAFLNYAPFTHGALTWSCTNDGGHTWTYPTAVLVGTGTGKYDTPATPATANNLGNMLSYYRVETILSANPGKVFNKEEYYKDAFEHTDDAVLRGRKFTISDRSKDGKTVKLTIEGIVVNEVGDAATSTFTSIELTQEMNFGSDDHVIIPADAAAKMPNYFYATINGERKKVEIANLASNRCHWVIYTDATCTTKMPENAQFEGTDWRLTGASANDIYYYARLEWDVDDTTGLPVWDYYNIGNKDDGTPKALKALYYGLYYEGVLTDPNGILDAVEADLGGFVVKFSVNAADDRGNGAVYHVAALKEEGAPEVRIDEYYDKAVVHVYGRNPECAYNTPDYTGAWTTFAGKMDCVAGDAIYKAACPGDRGYRTESPVVYTWYNPEKSQTTTLKQGDVSIKVGEPEWYEEVPTKLKAIVANGDLAKGLDTAHYLMFWDPQENILGSNGKSIFYPVTDGTVEFSIIVYIPVKKGYELTFTPAVKFNGKEATATEIVTAGGVTYLASMYTFKDITDWDITKDGSWKCLWDDLAVPFAGGTVQKTLTPTASSARYYEFLDITWYENGVEFTGDTFAQGKRYTAVVTWDCSNLTIKEDSSAKAALVGKAWLEELYAAIGIKVPSYVAQAKVSKSKKELTVTYEFPAADYAKLESINDINIEVPNGMEYDDFYKYVASQLVATLNFVGGTTGVKLLDGLYLNKGTELEEEVLSSASGNEYNAKVVEAALKAAYPGTLAYDKNKKAAQDFTLMGYINARNYGKYDEHVNINIHVAGVKSVITFNPNGGVYTGSTILAENGLAYGFKYVPQYIYREGYFFAGWFTAAEGGTRVKSATKFDGKTTTLYAHWVKVFTGKVWTLKAASYNAGRLTATATAPKTKVDGYEFSISKDGVNWTVNAQTKNVRYYVGLLSGTYFVKVRAYRLDSAGKFVYGAYSKTQKVVVK